MASNYMGRTRAQTEKGRVYAMESHRKELKKSRTRLSNQISLFDDLLNTRNVDMVKTELIRLESWFTEMKSVVDRLLDMVEREERGQLRDLISKKRSEVLEVGNRVERWLVSEGERDARSGRSKSSRNSEVQSNVQLTVKLIMVQSRLEDKLDLCDQLLESDDAEMVKVEVKNLESLNKEMKEISNRLGEGVSDEDRMKVADIVEKVDKKVQEIGNKVGEQISYDRKSQRSGKNREAQKTEISNSGVPNSSQKKEKELNTDNVKQNLVSPANSNLRVQDQDDRRSTRSNFSNQSKLTMLKNPSSGYSISDDKGVKNVKQQVDGRTAGEIGREDTTQEVVTNHEEDQGEFEEEDNILQLSLRFKELHFSKEGGSLNDFDGIQGKEPVSLRKDKDAEDPEFPSPKLASPKLSGGEDRNSIRSGRSRLSEQSSHSRHSNVSGNKKNIALITNGVGRKAASVKSWDGRKSNAATGNIAELKKPTSLRSFGSRRSLSSTKSKLVKVARDHKRLQNNVLFDDMSEKSYRRRDIELLNGLEENEADKAAECLRNLRLKMKNQDGLVRDLLATKNNEMMSKEVENLDKLYEQMVGNAETLVENLPRREAEEISEEINRVDMRMMETKRQVARWMAAQARREERSMLSGASINSRRSGGRNSVGKVDESLLRDNIRRLHERLEGQRLLIEDLLKANDMEMMVREVGVLEHLHGNLVAVVDKLSKVRTEREEDELEQMMTEEESKLFKIKKEVIRWMAAQAETDTRSQVSNSSRHTVMSGNSVGSRGKGNRKEGEHELKDQLWERLIKLRVQLNAKKSLCKELLTKTMDIVKLRQEMCQLEETYREAAGVALDLRELVPVGEAEKIMEKVEQEDVEIHQIKRSMVSQMAAECNLGSNETVGKVRGVKKSDEELECSLPNQDGKSREVEGKDASSQSKDVSKHDLEEELKRIGLRLKNQRSLVSDLLKSKDTEMMNREVQNLDKVYDDYVAAASQLRTLSLKKEAEEVSALIDAEDANVFQVKQLVSKWMVSQAEAPIDSAASRSVGHVDKSLDHCEETSRGHTEVGEVRGHTEVGEIRYKMAKDTEKEVENNEETKTLVLEGRAESCDKSAYSKDRQESKIEKLFAEVEALKKEKVANLASSRENGTTTKEPVKEVRFLDSKTSSKEMAEISELREEIEAIRREMQEESEGTENMESIVPGSTPTVHDTEITKLREEITALKRERERPSEGCKLGLMSWEVSRAK